MKHSVKVIFGKEQILKVYSNESLNEEEINTNVKNYEFNSIEEKNAFIKGLNEAVGWIDICIPEFELLEG